MKKKKIYLGFVSLVIFVILSVITYLAFAGDNSSNTDIPTLPKNNSEVRLSNTLPTYALQNPKVEEAYLFAKNNPDSLNGVNCHCGCMQMIHDGRIHKRGLIDCFLREDGSYEIHGSECAMCVVDALEVKDLMKNGKTKDEIKKIIDAKYAG